MIESVLRVLVSEFRPLMRRVIEHVEGGRFGLAERFLREGGIRILCMALEQLLARMEEEPLPRNRPCPSCGVGRLRSQGMRRKLLDTTLGCVSIHRCSRTIKNTLAG